MNDLKSWRHLVFLLVQRDLRVRYRGSVLGYFWSMMNPLLYMAILTIVFSRLVKQDIKNFPMFVLSGILSWNLFAQSLAIGVNSIVGNGSLMKKVRVPFTIFPAASVGSCSVNFVLALAPFFVVGLFTHLAFTPWILLLPLVLLPFLAFIFGIVLIVSSLNVSYRDVGHSLEPFLQMLYFATPIFYQAESLPESARKFRLILQLNPLSYFVNAVRQLMYTGTGVGLGQLALLYGMAAASLLVGSLVYRRLRYGFVYNV